MFTIGNIGGVIKKESTLSIIQSGGLEDFHKIIFGELS
ncbi:hypothetical protein XENE109146_11325 [Xenorhabdus nematophila]